MRLLVFSLFFFGFVAVHAALCVSSDVANLRGGPGKSYKLTWTVGKYMPFIQIGYKNGWYKVRDVDGVTHWVYQSLVSKRLKCAVVRVGKTNLRTGPGMKFSYAAYKTADKYTPFKRINQKGSWFQVVDASGNKVWLHENNIWRARKVSTLSF